MVRCVICGGEVEKVGDYFICKKCGRSFYASPGRDRNGRETCPNCGAITEPNRVFCPECGLDLRDLRETKNKGKKLEKISKLPGWIKKVASGSMRGKREKWKKKTYDKFGPTGEKRQRARGKVSRGLRKAGRGIKEGMKGVPGGAQKVSGASESIFNRTIDVLEEAIFGPWVAGVIIIAILWLFTGIVLEMDGNSWFSLFLWLIFGIGMTILFGESEEDNAINIFINYYKGEPEKGTEGEGEEERGKGGGEVQHDEDGTHGKGSSPQPGGRPGM